ncbi:MAG: response regulator [bacterium]
MEDKPLIMAVDHNPRNLELLSQFLAKEGYRVTGVSALEELDTILDRGEVLDLVLLDLAGYDRNIWDRCERLRKSSIPFLIISPGTSHALQQESLSHGARGVLTKPLVVKELLTLIRSLVGR